MVIFLDKSCNTCGGEKLIYYGADVICEDCSDDLDTILDKAFERLQDLSDKKKA